MIHPDFSTNSKGSNISGIYYLKNSGYDYKRIMLNLQHFSNNILFYFKNLVYDFN